MLLIIGPSQGAFRLTVRYVTLVGISDGQNLLQHRGSASRSLTKDGWPTSRSFFARCGIPLTLTAQCFGWIESQRERTVVSHIPRNTSEMWALVLRCGTRGARPFLVLVGHRLHWGRMPNGGVTS